MPLYADKVLQQMRKIGEPRVTTEETTLTEPEEPLDMMSLGMLLYFMTQGQGQDKDGMGDFLQQLLSQFMPSKTQEFPLPNYPTMAPPARQTGGIMNQAPTELMKRIFGG